MNLTDLESVFNSANSTTMSTNPCATALSGGTHCGGHLLTAAVVLILALLIA